MTVKNLTGLAGTFHQAIEDAVAAVLHALLTGGDERREHLKNAKLAVEQAMRDSHSAEQWYLADHLGRGIKEVELRARDIA